MAKIKQSPKLPAEERRRQLLMAARSLFLKKGFRGTTTEEIARKAGLTKGAIYFHFKNKEDILFELLKHMHAEVVAAIKAIPKGTGSPAELLRSLLEAKCIDSSADFVHYLDFWLQAWKIPKVRKHMVDTMTGYDEVFASRIDPAFASTPRERRDLAMLIFALYDGMIVRKMLGQADVSPERQIKLLKALTEGKVTRKARKQR
jgi:AcrR family transcriptional regulator